MATGTTQKLRELCGLFSSVETAAEVLKRSAPRRLPADTVNAVVGMLKDVRIEARQDVRSFEYYLAVCLDFGDGVAYQRQLRIFDVDLQSDVSGYAIHLIFRLLELPEETWLGLAVPADMEGPDEPEVFGGYSLFTTGL